MTRAAVVLAAALTSAVAQASEGARGTRPDSRYGGVTYSISDVYQEEWRKAGKLPPSPDEILGHMEQSLHDAVDHYEQAKTRLPSCLRDALDRLIAGLTNRTRTLEVKWEKADDKSPGGGCHGHETQRRDLLTF